jgi:hypothetical protein
MALILLFNLAFSPELRLGDRPQAEAASVDHATTALNGGLTKATRQLLPPDESALASERLRFELDSFLDGLKGGLSAAEVKNRRGLLQRAVHAAAPDAAAAVLISRLRTGEDAATGLHFVVGAEGIMAETPTYRTELLNLLGQTDPFQASDYSRELMGSASSQDEYALALRNLAWADFQGNQMDDLRSFFSAMLGREDWKADPTAGFLEAFDIAAFTGSAGLVAEVIEAAGPADGQESLVSRAAFVALDRIMLSKKSAVLASFDTDPNFLSEAPYHRASILSRLDPRQPDDIRLLESYLLRADHSSGELAYFAELFPNGNRFTSHRLVTSWERDGSIEEMAKLDQAALELMHTWMNDPKFSSRHQEMAAIAKRLDQFLQPVASP